MNRLESVAEFQEWQAGLAAGWDESKPCLRMCDGTGCRALGSRQVLAGLREELKKTRLDTPIEVSAQGALVFASAAHCLRSVRSASRTKRSGRTMCPRLSTRR